MLAVEVGANGKGRGEAQREEAAGDEEDPLAAADRGDVGAGQLVVQLGEASHHVAAAAVGADVVHAGDALFEEARKAGEGVADTLPLVPRQVAHLVNDHPGDDRHQAQCRADAHVLDH